VLLGAAKPWLGFTRALMDLHALVATLHADTALKETRILELLKTFLPKNETSSRLGTKREGPSTLSTSYHLRILEAFRMVDGWVASQATTMEINSEAIRLFVLGVLPLYDREMDGLSSEPKCLFSSKEAKKITYAGILDTPY
jgi:hypothetical protein